MRSFAYDSSHSLSFKHFAPNNAENEEMTPKDLITMVKDHENWTFIIKDTILINLGTSKEP